MNKRKLGSEYEERAAEYLCSLGFRILEKNYRCRSGEIDLIAAEPLSDGEVLVFCEVKYRADEKGGGPLAAVGYKKQQTILRVAQYYLYTHSLTEDTPCRFDVIGITPQGIEHIRNAFWSA